MRYCRRFRAGIPHPRVGHPRVTHPSATPCSRNHRTFDLHVLGTPPAFILSQDQTRHPKKLYTVSQWRRMCCLVDKLLISLTGFCYSFVSFPYHSSVVQVPPDAFTSVAPFSSLSGASGIIPLYRCSVKRVYASFWNLQKFKQSACRSASTPRDVFCRSGPE